jgi:hypothetical protein
MEVRLCICITACSESSGLAQRMIYAMSRNLNSVMAVLKFVYFFLQYKTKRRKLSGLGRYSTHRQKEFPFPGIQHGIFVPIHNVMALLYVA